MAIIARILVVSALAGILGAGLTLILLAPIAPFNEYIIPTLGLGCVAALIGAIAGAAGEIAMALRGRSK